MNNNFIVKEFTLNFYFQNFLLKEINVKEGIIVYSTETEAGMIILDLNFLKKVI